jgi:hypothetical protein
MSWHIERDADGLPVRLVWSPDPPRPEDEPEPRCQCGYPPPWHRRDCGEREP